MTTTLAKIPVSAHPRVVIVGGGFAGTELAKKLSKAALQVVLIDKNNYFTFQPLLYQVATTGLNATSIVYPYRQILEKGQDTFFRLAEVESIDPGKRIIETSIGLVNYDYLVIATGATTNFYGNEQIAQNAIAMKSVEDAVLLRNTLLCNFEKALQIGDEEQLNSLMDFVIVGGGPTGVEIAGALSELRKHVFPKDYRELDFIKMDIHLIQSGDHLLKGMSNEAAESALQFLEQAGVKVWLNRRVKSYDGYIVQLDNGEKLCTRTLIWAAGVTGAPIKGLNEKCITKGNRLKVDVYNRVTGYDNIFALGDIAEMATAENPDGYPMLAQPAIQQGRLLGQNLPKLVAGKPLKPFVYTDKGALATIGRNKAVADVKIFNKEIRTQGFFAWFIWLFVHLFSIVGFKNRLLVFINWMWNYLSHDAVMRVIIGAKKENEPVEKVTDKVMV